MIIIGVRSDTSSYNQPYAFYTSQRVAEFIKFVTQNTVQQLAVRFEGYCISGMSGVTHSYVEELLAQKKEATTLIHTKLCKCYSPLIEPAVWITDEMPFIEATSTRGTIGQMCYVNFDTKITLCYGTVLENWPLGKFCSPGKISSHPELETLIDVWTNGTTRFWELSDKEWFDWKIRRASSSPAANGGEEHGGEIAVTSDTHPDVTKPTPTLMPSESQAPAMSEHPILVPDHPFNDTLQSSLQAPSVATIEVPASSSIPAPATFALMGSDGRCITIAKQPRKTSTGTKKPRLCKRAAKSKAAEDNSASPANAPTKKRALRKKAAKGINTPEVTVFEASSV
ncbi:hypothetical protein C8Q78DRAFT_994518 [Trametes maxima]|nr:hypothetical protein C8Q78DRAFT_994518 [Trametes maxima]